MEQANLSYRVQADIRISKAELAHIMAVAARHYDGKCQEFGKSTVRYWHDWCGSNESDPPETVKTITVKWDEMDTVAKILEQERFTTKQTGIELYDAWTTVFRAIRDEQERVNAHHMMNDTETFTDSYRAQLKAKYGDGTCVIPQPAPTGATT